MMRHTLLIIIYVFFLLPVSAQGSDTTRVQDVGTPHVERVFTKEAPLVYEDAWDLWPYAFLNEHGEAVGYNVDLLKLIFERLRIPYVIKLKPGIDALNDLKAGRADLMLGMDASFHDEFAGYGQSVIQIFTHSVLHRKDETPVAFQLKDLANHQVIVHEGSFSHHLMEEHGWGTQAQPYGDMREAVQYVHNEPGHQIVWNTLSLKWLARTMGFDNLELTPVKMPHGEYKFMSNNQWLLQHMDSIYSVLEAEGALQPIQNKWFYPERRVDGIPSWLWWVVAVLLLIIVLSLVYYAIYSRLERHMTKSIRRSNNRLALILKTSKIAVWVYHVVPNTVTIYHSDGSEKTLPLLESFSQKLSAEDVRRVVEALRQITHSLTSRVTLEVKTLPTPEEDARWQNIFLSVLQADRNGRPTAIIGTICDVTEERIRQQQVKHTMLRYQSIFNSAMVDIVTYDAEGNISDMNEKASRAFSEGCNSSLPNLVNLCDVLGVERLSLGSFEPLLFTRIYRSEDDKRIFNKDIHEDTMYYELQLIPLRDADGRLVNVFGTGRDVTEEVHSFQRLRNNAELQERANSEINNYIRNIDYVLQNGGVRVLSYSPDTHMLSVFSGTGVIQYQLTQTRLLSLTADESKKTAQRVLNSMDNRSKATLKVSVKTILPVKDGHQLCLLTSFVPTLDEQGQVTGYLGMFRDITEIKSTEEMLAVETAKAQSVETVKNAFLRNMSYEIRTPLSSVLGFAELFEMEHNKEDEPFFINEIRSNSTHLLKLINDILFLSRLDAHMIEYKPQPVDFSMFFEGTCQQAWTASHAAESVELLVENTYDHLVIDIDSQYISIIINHLLTNAAAHTTEGRVTASYSYTGENLVMSFQDTGCGISEDRLKHIFERFVSSTGKGTGLGLSICHEIATQMGGKIVVKSREGEGTVVWVTLPCKCSEIVRKQRRDVL